MCSAMSLPSEKRRTGKYHNWLISPKENGTEPSALTGSCKTNIYLLCYNWHVQKKGLQLDQYCQRYGLKIDLPGNTLHHPSDRRDLIMKKSVHKKLSASPPDFINHTCWVKDPVIKGLSLLAGVC